MCWSHLQWLSQERLDALHALGGRGVLPHLGDRAETGVRSDAAAAVGATIPTDTSFGRGAALEVTYVEPNA
jgi:hypothetical protein